MSTSVDIINKISLTFFIDKKFKTSLLTLLKVQKLMPLINHFTSLFSRFTFDVKNPKT